MHIQVDINTEIEINGLEGTFTITHKEKGKKNWEELRMRWVTMNESFVQ